MSKAELELVLATPGPFVPGQTIEGFVGVTVNTSCRCRGLTVVLEWFTHGRGNRKTGKVQTLTVFEGDLVAGAKALHPFSMTVPAGPFTYEGTIVSVGWRVRANADLPWAFDPKTETTIVVAPGTEPLSAVDHGPASLSQAGRSQMGDVILLVVGGVFLTLPIVILGPLCIAFSLACVGNPSLGNAFPALIPAFMAVVFAYVGYRVLRPPVVRLIAGRRVSNFVLAAPQQASPGQPIEVRIELTPKRDILAEEIRFELRLSEVAVSGSGTKKTTHRHSETLVSVAVGQARTLQAKRPVTFSGELRVPESAGISFAANQNSVTYELVGVVDCPGVFDPEKSAALTIVPANLSRGR